MAVSTDITVSVESGGITYDTLGLSKTLDNYNFDELWNYAYCCANSNLIFHVGEGGNNVSYLTYQADNGHIPIELRTAEWGLKLYYPQDSELNQPDGLYMKMAWVQRTQSGSDKYISKTVQAQYYRLITEFKAPHYVYETAAPTKISNYYGAESWNDNDELLYYSSGGTLYYYDDVSSNAPIKIQIPYAEPVFLFKYNGKNYIIHYWQGMSDFYTKYNISGTPVTCSYATDYEGNTGTIAFPITSGTIYEYLDDVTGEYSSPYNEGSYIPESSGSYPRETYSETIIEYLRSFYSWDGSSSYYPQGFDQTNYFKTKSESIKFFSLAGLHFKCDKIYKPVIISGYVTGYTDDLTTASELDGWSGSTNHDIPDVPPSPTPPTPPEGDDIDDHDMGAGSGVSGMVSLWLLTASQLADLHGACNSAPVGFDPLNSFISVMGIATNPEYLTHEIQYITPINIRMSDGTTWQTGVEGHIVSNQVSAFSFTGITVQRKYNNFLDFSPYATHEIFVPMCGWITLPDIAVDRSITVTYIPDIESLKCRAVVSVVDNSGHKCVIGEKDGIMGADVPFTNVGHSLFVGDAIVNGADVAGEAITMAIGAGFTKTNAKGGTYRPYEGFTLGGTGTLPSAIGNAIVSGNINRTHFMTGNGTRIGFSDGENIQIKSVYHNVDIPPNYAHTVGLMCNKTGDLSEFTGFTVCDNPHITFSALEAEKEEIKRLLEEGVIL